MPECHICGENRSHVLHEHHVLPKRYGGQDTDSNTVTLCANCHNAVEDIYDDEFFEQLGATKAESGGVSGVERQVIEKFVTEQLTVTGNSGNQVEFAEIFRRYEDFCEDFAYELKGYETTLKDVLTSKSGVKTVSEDGLLSSTEYVQGVSW